MLSETETVEVNPEEEAAACAALLDEAVDDAIAEAEEPIHLAKCGECAHTVQYRANVTGTGFVLVATDPDAVYGIGEHGRPTCPNGHGEMAIADDRFKSATDAFAEAADKISQAQQASLPGVFPPFNYEGAFKEIVEQAERVEILKSDYDDAKQEASEAKKNLDKAAELLMRMTLEFERRRKEKAAGPPESVEPEAGPRLIRCTWEAKHDGEDCPICSGTVAEFAVGEILGPGDRAVPDAEAHVEDVDELLLGMEVQETIDALLLISTYVDAGEIKGWTSDERKAVTFYADQQHLLKSETLPADVARLERPTVLGKPHIPAEVDVEGRQVCAICDDVLVKSSTAGDAYQVSDYVGTDCSGKSKAVNHHYPKTSGKKLAKRKK